MDTVVVQVGRQEGTIEVNEKGEDEWKQGGRGRNRRIEKPQTPRAPSSAGVLSASAGRDKSVKRSFNPPAVLLKSRTKGELFAEVLRKAKEKISLGELGIKRSKVRRTATGDVLVEIFGNNTKRKADLLADRVRKELEVTLLSLIQ